MFLDLTQHRYDEDIILFIKNGIIIDTSVFDILLDGIVERRMSGRKSFELEMLLDFFDLMKVNNRWNMFYITPHILTEVCNHFKNKHSKGPHAANYKRVVKEVMPIIMDAGEHLADKNNILQRIDFQNPVLEVGDLSIFVVADNLVNSGKNVAILSNDDGINSYYKNNPKVLVMDYRTNILNRL